MDIKKKPFPEIIFLLLITALVYLPNIGGLTYFKDDWYYIYDGMLGGAKIFHTMFAIDRPARGYFFEWYFSLLGAQPLAWHISAYLWRALSAIGALWIFNILWKDKRTFAFFNALLFAIYPGYYWWMSAIEYQPMIASLALQVFSIAFTLKALEFQNKFGYSLAAILTGWAYIALVDYAIGMEIFRFLCVYLMIARTEDSFWRRIRDSFYGLNWQLLIPIGFLAWRVFLFKNEREVTDIGLQLGALFGDPIGTGVRWGLQMLNSLLNMSALAWVNQFPRFFFDLRMRDMAYASVFAALVIILVFMAEKFLRGENHQDADSNSMVKESALLGGLGMILGILPVIMANRYINNEFFSHYALPASLAAAVFVSGLIHSISLRRVQTAAMYVIIIFASLAHYGISISAVNEERALEKFWWQVSWRVPALEPDIMLVIHYPSANMGDDGNGATELPNMIYFPQPSAQTPVHYQVSAITLNDSNLREVLLGKLYMETDYRSHTVNLNYENVLVLSQPTPTSCVHVMDGREPLISFYDSANVILAAPSSNIENVVADAKPSTPQEFAFGKEPERGWCFYFEKADLAAQLHQWDKVTALGEKAAELELHPQDQSEWLPFLKAYAITGNATRVKQTASKIGTETLLRLQACDMLTKIQEPMSNEVKDLIATLYCKTAPK
jgi:hypothetical protein